MWFSQVRKNYGENLIILLDEPGLNLHAKAQKDLVGYINDRLKPDHQVIYTTHSPFMIDSANLSNVRIVEDADTGKEGSLGSKVGTKSISHDPDTLYPLQAALAYDMMNGLFTDKRALLVDGPTELLYLKWFSNELKQLGRTHLDERWTIVPAGGLEKIAGFMNLLGADRERLAVFTGVNQDSKRSGDSMLEYELLQGGRVLTPLMYLEGQAEADIEDMIGRQLYAALVNHCYDLNKRQIWNPQKAKEEPTRIVPEAESHFAAFTGSKHVFDRYTVAAYLLNHSFELIDVLTDIEQSMDRFENLFVDMNRLL